jgi:hypothetical protein
MSSSLWHQIYRPKSQLSTASSVLARSIREEERPPGLLPINNCLDSEHIYEEIRDQEEEEEEEAARMVAAAASRRPLPPLPPPASDISGRPSPTRQFDGLGREKKCIPCLLRCKNVLFFRIMYLYIYLKSWRKKWDIPSAT